MLRTLLRTDDSIAPLVLRVTLGAIILPHGLQKTFGLFGGYGLEGTLGFFTGQLGIPLVFAWAAVLTESLGALALILGLFGRVQAAAIGGLITVAAAMVHAGNGFFMNWNGNQAGEGYEYHLLVLGMAITLVLTGSGAYSLDRVLARKLEAAPAAARRTPSVLAA